MGRKKTKVLISIISVFMVCLLASTATTTVAAGDWGNLKVGDVMEWEGYDPYYGEEISLKMEILDINGDYLTFEYEQTYGTYSDSGTETSTDAAFLIFSQSYMQDQMNDPDPDTTWTTTNHDWQGNNYKTIYFKYTMAGGDYTEGWMDQETGICLEARANYEGKTYTYAELQSTTADLTEAGGTCLGTILIAFVSVATLVTYSLVRYQKKK